MGLFIFNVFAVALNIAALVINHGTNMPMMFANTVAAAVCIYCTISSMKRL